MKIKVLAIKLSGYDNGTIVDVPDVNGIPTDLFWRNRLRDSAIDQCCEVVDEITEEKPKAITLSNISEDDN